MNKKYMVTKNTKVLKYLKIQFIEFFNEKV